MIDELLQTLSNPFHWDGVGSRFRVLIEELERLDLRDFTPARRFEFVNLRRRAKNFQELSSGDWIYISKVIHNQPPHGNSSSLLAYLRKVELGDIHGSWANFPDNTGSVPMAQALERETREMLSQLSTVIESYLGADVRTKLRAFTYIRDHGLRQIVERDYQELTLKLFPTESWKSVVIIAGSILEALLFDLLTRDIARIAQAMSANAAPSKRSRAGTATRDISSLLSEDEWSLNNYIEVADQLSLLPKDWKASVQAVLRDFRNCVHPRRELKMSDKITQGEAFQSVGALMRICDHIEKHHS